MTGGAACQEDRFGCCVLPKTTYPRQRSFHIVQMFTAKQVIYDVDDDRALIRPEEGVPHADTSYRGNQPLPLFSSDPSSIVHNPYGCFGAPGVAWPRGYPLSEVQHQNSNTCELAVRDGVTGPRIAVVQALANYNPDVDAIYRLTYPPGGLPFDFISENLATSGSRLRGVPAEAMTPYNAQVSSPRLLHTAHTDWFEKEVDIICVVVPTREKFRGAGAKPDCSMMA